MKKIIITVSILFMSFMASAEQALSKDLILKYFSVTDQLEILDLDNSSMLEEISDVMLLDREEAIRIVESLDEYPQIKSITDSAGFTNFENFLDIGYRVIGSMYAVQLKQNPELMQIQNFTAAIESQIDSMKKRNMPKEVIDEMEREVASQKNAIESMSKAAKDASSVDITYVENNFEWLMSILPGYDE
ncbi:hypothetical protein [Cognaticolwellia mytili]|uniref:hypothetical protein n=1 Tax=Cognaticolwellia mytili TaxID=1888913 RepID=UPI000A177091|nr:hypothetical protein [Cognaticolwellia mytili]